MTEIFLLLLMVFMHIVDDYYLQRILASMKQKSWWKENAPQPLYKYDYIVALLMHSFSWSFMIMLPLVVLLNFRITAFWVWMLFINMGIHALVDNLKANALKINLIVDQSIHIIQIIVTFFLVRGTI